MALRSTGNTGQAICWPTFLLKQETEPGASSYGLNSWVRCAPGNVLFGEDLNPIFCQIHDSLRINGDPKPRYIADLEILLSR